MKNQYTFCNLEKIETNIEADKKSEIFFNMNKLLEQNKNFTLFDSVDELNEIMEGNNFFVAHKSITYKGKKQLFTGDLAIATKQSLINFIRNSIANDDLRSLLIAPFFDTDPEYVIYIHEDVTFMYYLNEALTK